MNTDTNQDGCGEGGQTVYKLDALASENLTKALAAAIKISQNEKIIESAPRVVKRPTPVYDKSLEYTTLGGKTGAQWAQEIMPEAWTQHLTKRAELDAELVRLSAERDKAVDAARDRIFKSAIQSWALEEERLKQEQLKKLNDEINSYNSQVPRSWFG